MLRALNNKLPFISGLLLLGIFFWLVGQYVWLHFFDESKDLLSKQATGVSTVNNPSQKTTHTSVALFGKKVRTKTSQKKKVQRVKANLNIKLVGTFMGPKAVALIDKSGKTDAYNIGESIMSGVKLLEIHPDYLVISHNGAEKTITMEIEVASLASNSPTSPLLPTASLPNTDDEQAKNTVEKIKELGALLVDNPVMLSSLLVSKPIREENVIIGFEVRPKGDKNLRPMFDYLQLEAGDIVTSINGIAVTDYATLAGLKSMVSSGSSISITVKRAGEEKLLSVNLP